MPGKEHNRKIVSKAQQRYLFAAANRGEISKTKVEHMAEATEKSKGSLKNLPARIGKKSSVDMQLRASIASGNYLSKVAACDRKGLFEKAASLLKKGYLTSGPMREGYRPGLGDYGEGNDDLLKK